MMPLMLRHALTHSRSDSIARSFQLGCSVRALAEEVLHVVSPIQDKQLLQTRLSPVDSDKRRVTQGVISPSLLLAARIKQALDSGLLQVRE